MYIFSPMLRLSSWQRYERHPRVLTAGGVVQLQGADIAHEYVRVSVADKPDEAVFAETVEAACDLLNAKFPGVWHYPKHIYMNGGADAVIAGCRYQIFTSFEEGMAGSNGKPFLAPHDPKGSPGYTADLYSSVGNGWVYLFTRMTKGRETAFKAAATRLRNKQLAAQKADDLRSLRYHFHQYYESRMCPPTDWLTVTAHSSPGSVEEWIAHVEGQVVPLFKRMHMWSLARPTVINLLVQSGGWAHVDKAFRKKWTARLLREIKAWEAKNKQCQE